MPAKIIEVDGRKATVKPVPWRLFRKLAGAVGDAQLDAMEEIVVKCAEVDGIAGDALLDELSRPAVEALFAAAVKIDDDDAAESFG